MTHSQEHLSIALDLARKNHENQFRQTGQPYIEHPKRVMRLLAEVGFDREVQIAGVLHDVLEDGHDDVSVIRRLFGEGVALMVQAVSKWPKGAQRPKEPDFLPCLDHPSSADYRLYWHLVRMELYASIDPRCLAVKAADQADNLIDYTPRVERWKIQKKIDEVSKVYLPFYRRLQDRFSRRDRPRFDRLLRQLEHNLLRMQVRFGAVNG